MEINIFRHEFKANLRSVAVWSASIVFLILVFEALFPSFSRQAEQINEALANFPPQLLAAFGMNGADMASVLGFFTFIFVFIQVCMAIQASNYGFSLVSVEEREWTADFLLTRPLTRTRILTSKLLAALCFMAITDVVVWASAFICVGAFSAGKPYDASTLALIMASIVPFQLFFFSVGLAVSLLVKKIRSVMPYSLSLSFVMYVFNVFGGLLGTSFLEGITPFRHFEAKYVIEHGGFDPALVGISLAVIVISVVAGYFLYNRRDIPGVS